MRAAYDWKFFLTLVLTLAGVVVPVVLWQADLSSRALSIEVISSTNLDPNASMEVKGLAVTVDGNAVPLAFVSVLKLQNVGSRPVLASEFELPIEVEAKAPTRLVKAQMASATPPDLKPVLAQNGNKISIQPLLLNPRDSILLSVLTAEGRPVFAARSRIAGVASIAVVNSATTRNVEVFWVRDTIGVLLFTVYLVQMVQALEAFRRRPAVVQLWTIFTAVVAALGGIYLLSRSGSNDSSLGIGSFLIRASPSVPLAIALIVLRERFRKSASAGGTVRL